MKNGEVMAAIVAVVGFWTDWLRDIIDLGWALAVRLNSCICRYYIWQKNGHYRHAEGSDRAITIPY